MGPASDAPILLFGDRAQGEGRDLWHIQQLLQRNGLQVEQLGCDAPDLATSIHHAALLCLRWQQGVEDAQTHSLTNLLDCARRENVTAVIWGMPEDTPLPEDLPAERFSADASVDEVAGRLTVLARYLPIVQGLDREVDHLRRLGNHLRHYFAQVDKDLSLAGRLQRDFLPRRLPDGQGLRFGQLYRPAGWVSGDIFDMFRIDDRHVGIFIADVMGHGVAAGLLTMFLRKALPTTYVNGNGLEVLSPVEALQQVHESLLRHQLPNAQFVTSAYAILDVETLRLQLARGGHPYPLRITPDGAIEEIQPGGGLLGIDGLDPEFELAEVQLHPGDKLLFYTDGIEEVFVTDRDAHTAAAAFSDRFREWARRDVDGLIGSIMDHLDHQAGSLNPEDDITVLAAQVGV